jgi:uncharacterized protein (DUF1800 family)
MPLRSDHIATHDNTSTLAPYKGKWDDMAIVHLLKRTMFGAKRSDVDHFKKLTLTQAVDELLTPILVERSLPLNDYDFLNEQNIRPGATWINAPYYEPHDNARISSFVKWKFERFIHQDRSLKEKMDLFWNNHFATESNINRSQLIWNHYQLLNENALGNFKTLTKKITLDCHMLRYLNGEKNTSLAPNENYARELQELFCIGKGANSKYTEEDVKQAAKVLTGWKVDLDKSIAYFKEDEHDITDKKFSAFYNNKIIKGRKGAEAGEGELDELLNMIFANEETALFICRKLYRWFVYYNIDDAIEKNVIVPLAQTLRKNNYEIKPVLKQLFRSDHFFDSVIRGAQIKSPIDFVIGLQREFDVQFAAQENYAVNYSMYTMMAEQMSLMGQTYTLPPNVSGWPAYYQAPGFYELWINTSTYPARNEFSNTMVNFGYNRENRFFAVDVVAFAKSLSKPQDPNSLIEESLALLYSTSISAASKQILKKNTLLSGQEQDHYWTDAWQEYIAASDDQTKRSTVEIRLKALYQFIVNSPEYQLA